jgi:hypothetical protein
MSIYQRIASYFGRTFAGFAVATAVLFLCLVKYPTFFEHWSYIWLAAFGVLAGKGVAQNVTAIVTASKGGQKA